MPHALFMTQERPTSLAIKKRCSFKKIINKFTKYIKYENTTLYKI